MDDDDEEEYDYSDIFYGSGEGYSTEEAEDEFVTESPSAGQGCFCRYNLIAMHN